MAWIRPLAWELPYALGAAEKEKKKKKAAHMMTVLSSHYWRGHVGWVGSHSLGVMLWHGVILVSHYLFS